MLRSRIYRVFNFFYSQSRNISIKTSLNKSINLSESGLLRKLGTNELYYNEICSNGFNQIICTITIETELDLYSNLISLEKAIQLWKLQHPFLNCTVSNYEEEKYFLKVKNPEFLNNVEFLKYTPFYDLNSEMQAEHVLYQFVRKLCPLAKQQDDNRVIWSKINDIFLNTPLTININEYLWKLFFIKLDSTRYCVVFNSHFEIVNQSACFSLVKQLFKIIDATYAQKPLTSEFHLIHQVPKSLEEYFKSQNRYEFRSHKLPKSILDTDCSAHNKVALDGIISKLDKDTRFLEQVTLNKKAEKLILDKNMTKKFLENCKLHSTEPSSCLAVLMSLALQKAFKNFIVVENEILYTLAVSINQLVKEKIHNQTLGHYDTQIVEKIDTDDLNEVLESGETNKLWKLANKETRKNDDNFSEEKMFEYSVLKKEDLDKILNNYDSNEFIFHFSISNFGSHPTFPNLIGKFKILDLQSGTTTSKYGIQSYLFNISLCSVNDELNINFNYQTALRQEFIRCVIDTFNENLKQLL